MKVLKATTIAILFFVATSATSQVRFDLGLKGGLNFASVSTSSSIAKNYEGRTGYHLGAYAMLKFTKFAIQPEVIFSRQGQNFSTSSVSDLESSFDYFNVPIMIKFYLVGGLNIQAGPQFGFLSSAKGDVVNNTTNAVTKGQDLTSLIESSDVSLGVGAGWDLPFGLNITARYNIGLSDVNKFTNNSLPPTLTSSLGTSQAKNQVFQFSLGYRLFKFGK
ncbi:MAG: porin family protein [Cyclobacteriaceae bacterium]|nr:porin family protein [Cyclobacteriaceae bacterium]